MSTDLLIVGGDGDLALRKLYPSLYYLEINDCMPDDMRIIGSARTGQTREAFHAKIKAGLIRGVDKKLFSEEKWQRFADRIYFGQGDATKPDQLKKIGEELFREDAFANDFFEPLWNNKYIESVQITVTETVGVGNRWAFYDQTGATRDMVQNHLLQVLCLMAMEPPAALDADSVRSEKLKVLKSLK